MTSDLRRDVCLVVQLETFLLNIYSKVGLFTLDPSQERTEAESPEFRGNLERLLLQAGKEGSARGERDALGSSRSEKEKKRNDLIMDSEVFDYYMEQFGAKGGGIDGALNWYRTRKMNFDDEQSQCRRVAGIPNLRPPLTLFFTLSPGLHHTAVKEKNYPTSFPVLAVVPDRDVSTTLSDLDRYARDKYPSPSQRLTTCIVDRLAHRPPCPRFSSQTSYGIYRMQSE
jgi:hypothetical protein